MADKWILCRARMPKDLTYVIVLAHSIQRVNELKYVNEFRGIAYRDSGRWFFGPHIEQDIDKFTVKVTHWTPLPPMPEYSLKLIKSVRGRYIKGRVGSKKSTRRRRRRL